MLNQAEIFKVRHTLSSFFTEKGINKWLNTSLSYLDDKTPVELLKQGEFEKVEKAARKAAEGVYL